MACNGRAAVHGVLAGVGGVNVPPRRIQEMVRAALQAAPEHRSEWGTLP